MKALLRRLNALPAIPLILVAFVLAWLVFNPVEEAADTLSGLASSPADVRCLEGWTTTDGTDPDGKIDLRVCTSPDKRYVITVRENQGPVGYDATEKRFLNLDEIAGYLR